jgi:hypothetical protein
MDPGEGVAVLAIEDEDEDEDVRVAKPSQDRIFLRVNSEALLVKAVGVNFSDTRGMKRERTERQ